MIIKTIQVVCLIILGLSNTAMAETYLGVSGGGSAVDTSGYEVGLSQKVFAGLRNQDSGLEIAFINLGDFTPNDGSGTVKITGFSFSIMPYFPLNKKFEFFGKLGGFAWNASTPAGNITFTNNDGFGYSLGLGANLNFFRHFLLRIEVEKFYQIGATNSGTGGTGVAAITAGAVFIF